jgi:DNA-binding transcriptional ArsR family regulator
MQEAMQTVRNLDPARLAAKASAAATLLRALANENRLMILCKLIDGERSVGELVAAVGLSQSALSQHLAKLRADRLVATRREAQTIHYRLASSEATRVMQLLADIYCAPVQRRKDRPS